jgi:hypothetical protein
VPVASRDRSGASARRVGRGRLHLLWTVPLALAVGYLPAVLVRFERCGIRECLGEATGFDSPVAPSAMGVAVLAAAAMFAALAATPWLRPTRRRLAIALAVALGVLIFYVWVILFR